MTDYSSLRVLQKGLFIQKTTCKEVIDVNNNKLLLYLTGNVQKDKDFSNRQLHLIFKLLKAQP